MSEFCPTCGSPVRVVSGREGTARYEPESEREMSHENAARTARVMAGLYPLQNPWRVGRRVGRTIYAQIGPEPSDDDPLIGVMDTEALARRAVSAHNAGLIYPAPVHCEEGE